MATLSYIREQKQNASAMKRVICYCTQDHKVTDPETERRYVSGVNCDGENSFAEFMTTKKCFYKTNGIFFYQYTQSFSPEENITPALAHEIALEFAERAWQGYEVMVATHVDREHIHTHFIINSVSYVDGKKLRQSPNTLKELRALNDEICRAHGLRVLQPYTENHKGLSPREYRAAVKGQSWKFRLMASIEDAMNNSGNKDKFIYTMEQQGYEITWTDERKYITFTCPNGMKCRDVKLHDDKFTKEMMELEFRYREQITGQILDQKSHREESGADEYDRESRSADSGDDTIPTTRSGDRIAENSVTVPAGAVQTDFPTGNEGRAGESHQRDCAIGGRLSEENDSELFRTMPGDDQSAESAIRTGWEESRELYFRMLLGTGVGANEAQRTNGAASPTHTPSADLGIHNGSGSVGAGILSALPRSPLIEDDSEDEEERRKRIEAEQNGADIGAALGLTIGLIATAVGNSTEDIVPEDDAEQDEEWIQHM